MYPMMSGFWSAFRLRPLFHYNGALLTESGVLHADASPRG